MESITYGDTELTIIKTNFVLRENKRTEDGTTTLTTKWTIDVIANVNPKYYRTVNGVEFVPGIIDDIMREALMQPRQLLIVRAGGFNILQAPTKIPGEGEIRYPCDANNGPFCEVFAIKQIIGVMHFVVHCRFTAEIVDAGQLTEMPHPLISNRWTATEDIDELLYPTRHFVGEAILRTDVMRALDLDAIGGGNPAVGAVNFNADSLRQEFFFPVPDNYQRENVKVELSSDGAKLLWSFTDVGRCYNLGQNSPIRKIEAYQNNYLSGGGIGRSAAQGLNAAIIAAAENPITTVATGGINTIGNATGTVVREGFANLPKFHLHCRVDLWGEREITRRRLLELALGVCLNQMGAATLGIVVAVGLYEVIVRQALHEKFVSVEISCSWGMDLAIAAAVVVTVPLLPVAPTFIPILVGGALFAGARAFEQTIFGDDRQLVAVDIEVGHNPLTDRVTVLDQSVNGTKRNPGFPSDAYGGRNLSGSQTLTRLVAQVLQFPGEVPDRPTIPMRAN